jgi:hypothetical protein
MRIKRVKVWISFDGTPSLWSRQIPRRNGWLWLEVPENVLDQDDVFLENYILEHFKKESGDKVFVEHWSR